MKKLLFLLCSVMVLLTSCSKDDDVTPSSEKASFEQRGLEGAKQRLAKILATPEFRDQLRTKDNPMGVAVIAESSMFDRHGDLLTRAEEDSANIYVFEFEDGGYAVLGEPPHMPELLAFAADGGIPIDQEYDPLYGNYQYDLKVLHGIRK